MNVKLNDNVVVITGKYAGKQGKVVATSPKNGTVTVEGVNLHKKAKKARKANEVSKIIEIEAPIDVSNVMVVCSSCGAVLDKAFAKAVKAAKKEEAPKKRVRKRAKKEEAETAESGNTAE